MRSRRVLTITKANTVANDRAGSVIPFESVKGWVRNGTILRHLFQYDEVRLRTQLLQLLPKPLLSALLIRGLSRGSCTFEDEMGLEQRVGFRQIATLALAALRDLRARRGMLAAVRRQLMVRESERQGTGSIDLDARPMYLRTDYSFGIRSGGSIGHIAGVVNNLGHFAGRPILVTTDAIPTVSDEVETWLVQPNGRFRDFAELPIIAFNLDAADRIRALVGQARPSFIYQRYGLDNFTGVSLASAFGIPLILEYNGSELWIYQQWGGGRLKYRPLAEQIERFNLERADLIVVVSDVMRDELVQRGVDGTKVLPNPNGVDPDVYRPDIDAKELRSSLVGDHPTVIGFIGTFGPWHGAEVLAQAFGQLLASEPRYRESVRLVMIGDGDRLAATRQVIEACGATAETVFVGRTAQEEGPRYLAACDILASPHVPNADGSRFFGSPTKLFEYMAMGKGIVASDLEQIGDVLDHDRTAWLVKPGDVDDLVAGLKALIDDPERRNRLGRAAREEAVAKYTWREHTRRIVDKLVSLEADRAA